MKKGMKALCVMFVIFALILASGCELGKKTETPETEKAFIGGTEGVVISFAEDEPRDMIYAGEQFSISIYLQNKGEFDSKKVFASLSGINKDAFGLISLDKELIGELTGRSVEQPSSIAEDEISFENAVFSQKVSVFKPTIKADVCYLYGTYAIADLCLKRDAYAREEGAGCEVASVLSSENSGAPLQITEISARPSGTNEIKMTFTIENKGTGEVYLNDAFEKSCRRSDVAPGKQDKVLVSISPTTFGSSVLSCSGFGEGKTESAVSLVKGKKTVHCTVNTKDMQDVAFSERININAYYFYKESETKEITIKG